MSASPRIADTSPRVLNLQPGTYFWCACGRSQNQPFCDGSHAGTGFEPVEWVVEAPKRYALCMCKHTARAPLCDGNHRRVPAGQGSD